MPRKPRLHQVAILIETSRAYGRGLVEGIGRYVEEHAPWSIFFEERGLWDPLPQWLKDWQGDGIIARTVQKTDLSRILAKGLPTVELLAEPDGRFASVTPDRDAVARMAADHFMERGFRNFAFFRTDDLWWMLRRQGDFEAELLRRGHACRSFSSFLQQCSTKAGPNEPRTIARWLDALPRPCGVFCASDFFAARLLGVCRQQGIAVPEEVAVLGVDNDSVMCSICCPPLSSIELGSRRIGYEAAALLERMMARKKAAPQVVSVQPETIFSRQSTDTLAIQDADIAQAIRFIRKNACDGLNVDQVVESVGLSRRCLEQRFRQIIHCTPKCEITRIQIDRARKLLLETELSIETISHRSGFHSFKYFARAFQRVVGMTPRDFRRRRRVPFRGS